MCVYPCAKITCVFISFYYSNTVREKCSSLLLFGCYWVPFVNNYKKLLFYTMCKSHINTHIKCPGDHIADTDIKRPMACGSDFGRARRDATENLLNLRIVNLNYATWVWTFFYVYMRLVKRDRSHKSRAHVRRSILFNIQLKFLTNADINVYVRILGCSFQCVYFVSN